MTVDVTKLALDSMGAGLGSTGNGPATLTIPSQTLSVGTYQTFTTSIPLNNTDAITTLLATVTSSIAGVSGTYLVNGYAACPPGGTSIYLSITTYYANGNLNALVVLYNNTGSSLPITAITIDYNASVFSAPF